MKWTTEQLEYILNKIIDGAPKTKGEFDDLRRIACSDLKTSQPPNRIMLQLYQEMVKKKRVQLDKHLVKFFQKAGIRSTSGIAVVTSLLKPYSCPGKCIYCPTEVRMPKSYIASEPAAARSLRLNFNPYTLMQRRIEALEVNGHPTDKIEYITKGGTWNAYPLKYQYWYILESFKACNNLTRKKEVPFTEEEYWNSRPLAELQEAVEREQRYNEGAKHRIIGITLETRPDAINAKTIAHMRAQGCTRVELGLQATDNHILDLVKRGHTVEEFQKAMYLLRSAGFKVDLHFMPDLPGTTPENDVKMYKEIFSDPTLKPDMIKIYPNTVIKSAELYQWFLDGRYKSYGDEALFSALLQMKKSTPRYCRISRLIRDIPATEIEDGNKTTNLREMLAFQLKQEHEYCQCLRCREINRQKNRIEAGIPPQMFVDQYETLGGTEYFITFEDPERIAVYGFLRLRIPKNDREQIMKRGWDDVLKKEQQVKKVLPEIADCAFVRELHVYGDLVKIGKNNQLAAQHKGYGKRLLQKAEEIILEQGFSKSAVISGVGVRGYYRKIGYRKVGTYMVKSL